MTSSPPQYVAELAAQTAGLSGAELKGIITSSARAAGLSEANCLTAEMMEEQVTDYVAKNRKFVTKDIHPLVQPTRFAAAA